MEIKIEKAKLQDIDEVEMLYDQTCDYLAGKEYNPGWRKGYFPTRDDALHFLKKDALYIARAEGKIVGSVALTHSPRDEADEASRSAENASGDYLYIHIFMVHPDYQQRGIGSEILRFAERFSMQEGVRALRLYVYEKNSVAIKAYERNGFVYLDKEDIGLSEWGLKWFCLYEKAFNRCPWCLINKRQTKYHDREWGVPVHDDRKQFEYLMLEVMQCGLSWDIVLKKREVFRGCFDDFDFNKIAEYTEQDIERIMNTPDVIRSRRKIQAVIGNARCVQQICKEYGTFSEYLWSWTEGKTLLYEGHELGDIPASNELSDRISKDMKKRGFKYLGSITLYAHLQACGIINDHIKDCHCYKRLLDQYDTERVKIVKRY